MAINLRPATPADVTLLRQWDEQDHVVASDPDSDWQWERELRHNPDWREQLIAQADTRPIGFVQIIDPVVEEGHYWGDYLQAHESDNNRPDLLRAIDIWIGEADCLNRGYGTVMMQQALVRCFAPATVRAVLVDPLVENRRAHRFYQRLGFVVQEACYFDNDHTLVFKLSRQRWLNH